MTALGKYHQKNPTVNANIYLVLGMYQDFHSTIK